MKLRRKGLPEMKLRNRCRTIRQIEFELEKAEHGMALPYDTRAGGETGTRTAMTPAWASAVASNNGTTKDNPRPNGDRT